MAEKSEINKYLEADSQDAGKMWCLSFPGHASRNRGVQRQLAFSTLVSNKGQTLATISRLNCG